MMTFIAAMPIVGLALLLSVGKMPAWKASLIVLIASAFVSHFFGLSPAGTLLAAQEGARTGLFPIGLVIVGALFVYAVVVESKQLAKIREGLSAIAPNNAFAALMVVWGFGNFMEGMAGFGTAVAVPCAILVGLGFDPVKAVLCCLVANTTPTAFGSVGVPTVILAREAGVEVGALSGMIAFLQAAVTALGPFLVLFVTGGIGEVRRNAALALIADLAFIVPSLLVARFVGCEMPDIVGGLAVMGVFAALGNHKNVNAREQLAAWAPFGCAVVLLSIGAIAGRFYKISPGILLVIAGFIGAKIQGIKFIASLKLFARVIWKYAPAIGTICAILALAKIMDRAGMIAMLASALVDATGAAFAFFSPLLGSLGSFVTGSGTSSCVLFGKLQSGIGAPESRSLLYAAANVMGAGIGKMICPQSIVLGAAAAGIAGRENELFLRSLKFFVPLALLAGAIVLATAYFK